MNNKVSPFLLPLFNYFPRESKRKDINICTKVTLYNSPKFMNKCMFDISKAFDSIVIFELEKKCNHNVRTMCILIILYIFSYIFIDLFENNDSYIWKRNHKKGFNM